MKFFLAMVAVCTLTMASTLADTTSATLEIGGPGSCGCGDTNPGTLCDGVTLATGTFQFTLDTDVSTLTLVVDNTSPDDGNPNPLMCELYFNLPRQITGCTLNSQSAAGAVQPSFGLSFDSDLLDGNNPNRSPGGKGAYSVLLDNGGGVAGAIGNPNASNHSGPPGSIVLGTATFVFDLTGDLSDIDVTFITKSFSLNPPGSISANAVVHFQAGGPNEDSGTISDNTETCDPLFYAEGNAVPGGTIDLIVNGAEGCHGCIVLSDQNQGLKVGPIQFDVGPSILAVFGFNLPAGGLTPFSVNIPNNQNLIGNTYYSQWVAVDFNTWSFETSNVVEITIQAQ
ncbi:MAG: hypothetical protein RL885_27580 [Planctomycetota bacterium]